MKYLKKYAAFFLAFTLICTAAFFVPASASAAASDYKSLFTADYYAGEDKDGMPAVLPYRLYVPQDYDPQKSYPVVLFLHGAGERGVDNDAQLNTGIASYYFQGQYDKKYPAIIVAPQCPTNLRWVEVDWGNGDYRLDETEESTLIKLSSMLVDDLAEQYNIDPDRKYVTGISMGGYGTWNIIMHHPDQFAAAMPICGAGDSTKAGLIKDVNIWTFHGDKDTIVPPDGTRKMAEALKNAGSTTVNYTEYPGVEHGSWVNAYMEQETFDWLFSQVKKGSDVSKSSLEAKLAKAEKADTSAMPAEDAEKLAKAKEYAAEVLAAEKVTKHQINAAKEMFPRLPGELSPTTVTVIISACGAAVIAAAAVVLVIVIRRKKRHS